jgi:type II secretory pathway component PulF
MMTYRYLARDFSGRKMEGTTQAGSEIEVLGWLREQGCTPICVAQVQSESAVTGRLLRSKRVKSAELAAIFWQLTTLVEGGVTLTEALGTVAEDVENKKLQKVLNKILEDIEKGAYFSVSMENYPSVFNKLVCALISAGEACGNIGEALRRVAVYFQNRDRLSKKVMSAMAYPAFVLSFVVLIVSALIIFVIPKFIGIFKQLGGKLPAFTKAFIDFYDMLKTTGPYILISVLIVLLTLILIYRRTKTGHRAFSYMFLKIPLFGQIFKLAFVARICNTMSALLAGGVPVLEIFDILPAITTNDVFKKAVNQTKEGIVEGSSICSSMSKSRFFPTLVIRMVRAGEESGSLRRVLERTAEYYEEKVDALVATVMALLEPVMILSVGAVVLVVIIALYLPIFEMSNIRG